MKLFPGILSAFLGISLLLSLQSCMYVVKDGVDDAILLSRRYLADGDFQKALDTHMNACAKYPEDQTLFRSYVSTVEEIKKNAGIAFDRNDFASAGRIYNILIKNYSDFRGISHSISFDRAFLIARIKECRSQLTQKGLEQYRKGNIRNAISIWESLLEFDPDNTEIRKAVENATTQLKNLQEKK
ncbi:MAG: hypothetical protein AB1632_11260 [Nitrospirota bacterium]